MVEDDRNCVDILVQMAVIRSALEAVDRLLPGNHARQYVQAAIDSGNPADQWAKSEALIALLQKTHG